MSAERIAAAAELLRVLESAFPGDAVLPGAVKRWVGYETPVAARCAVCRRSFGANAVIAWATRIQLVRGSYAGEAAVCGDCLSAAKETFAVAAAPSWDMQIAQIERALALMPEGPGAIARECLAMRPQAIAEGRCLLCEKAQVPIARGHAAGLCSACATEGRRVLEDLATQREVDSDSTRCPQCGSHQIASGIVGIEFTEMTCLNCGHSEICDVWQLAEWR